MTKSRETGEVLNTRGTMALVDKQASPTDTAAGRGLVVGAFGLGSTDNTPSIDCDTFLESGRRAHSTSITNGPSGQTFGIVICDYYTTDSSGRGSQHFIGTSGIGIWQRTMTSGTWAAWQRIDPQAFGWGLSDTTALTVDVDTLVSGGMFNIGTTSTNKPPGAVNGTLLVGAMASRTTHLYQDVTGLLWSRSKNPAWSTWKPVYNGANYQPEDKNGIGARQMMFKASGSDVVEGGMIVGGNLGFTKLVGGAYVNAGGSPSGVWKLVQSATLTTGGIGLMVRES